MTSQATQSCEEKPRKTEKENEEMHVMFRLAVVLGVTIVVAALLDLFAKGIPLGFVMAVLNQKATVANFIYEIVVPVIAVYVLVEKVVPAGAWLGRAAGLALVSAGVWLVVGGL